MKITRNQQQEIGLAIIYSALSYVNADVVFDVEELIETISGIPIDEVPIFLKELTIKTLINIDKIINEITPKLVKWKFHRLNRVIQAILLMSYTHYFYIGNVDKRIVINVAIKLTKRYVVGDEYKFVNAILDEVLVDERA
ncbi:MAG TPA: transcription antitermination factor NusB [Bacilli bacterium]|jgi:transcription termination factor NusB|nr:transcription antitermination factor NusB [Bacilli bacterium]